MLPLGSSPSLNSFSKKTTLHLWQPGRCPLGNHHNQSQQQLKTSKAQLVVFVPFPLLGLLALPPSLDGWLTYSSAFVHSLGKARLLGKRLAASPAHPPAASQPAPQPSPGSELRAALTRSSAMLALLYWFIFTCNCSAATTSKMNSGILERKTLFCFSY